MANGEILIGTVVDPSQALILSHGTKVFNEGFERGEKAERERIIKLLENERDKYHKGSLFAEVANEFLALIKGENK